MESSRTGPRNTTYACKCLNVKLRSKQVEEQPDLPKSPEHKPVYVEKNEDIKIVFPHLTLRTRKRGPYIPHPEKTARYTSLTCLCCQMLVYRVHQVVTLDDKYNLKEGPLVTKGWTETEVLRSSSGWVDIFEGVQTDEEISALEASANYSSLFQVVLLPSTQPSTSEALPEHTATPEPIPRYQLPSIPPVFSEPRSTTSLYAVLASLAGQKSASLRSSAEEYIDGIVKEKVEEIKRAENQLKRDVHFLLMRYNDGVKKAEQEEMSLHEDTASRDHRPSQSTPEPASPTQFSSVPASVVRDFVPTAVPRKRPVIIHSSSSTSAPRVSSLSASLATSSFHHPKAARSPPQTPTSLASSATLIAHNPNADLENVYRWGRNTDEQLDVATSYNYFLNLEEEMERRRQVHSSSPSRPSPVLRASQETGPSTSSNRLPNDRKQKQPQAPQSEQVSETQRPKEETTSPSSKSKGKRKVTFDVKVNQVPEDDTTKVNDSATLDNGEMLFDFEEEVNGKGENTRAASLPLLEQPAPRSTQQPRKRSLGNISESFSSLRPSSLPQPSHMPIFDQASLGPDPGPSDSTPVEPSPLPPESNISPIPGVDIPKSNGTADSEASKYREEMMEKLAASMPSHRAAWRNDSKAFESFLTEKTDDWNHGDLEESVGSEMVGNEHTDDQLHTGYPGSVPVTIQRPSVKPKTAPLSLASYTPETFLSNRASHSSRRSSDHFLPQVPEVAAGE